MTTTCVRTRRTWRRGFQTKFFGANLLHSYGIQGQFQGDLRIKHGIIIILSTIEMVPLHGTIIIFHIS